MYSILLFFIFCYTSSVLAEAPNAQIKTTLHYFFPETPAETLSITPLAGGYSDTSNLLIQHNQKKYVLKVYNPKTESIAINRELYAMQEASSNGIAPDKTAVLIDFIDSKTATIESAKKYSNCKKIAEALRKAHAISQNPYPRIGAFEMIERKYIQLCQHIKDKQLAQEAMQLMRQNHAKLVRMNVQKVNIHFLHNRAADRSASCCRKTTKY